MIGNIYSILKTDVLVIGGGGAALRAALAAHENGAKVTIAVKGKYSQSGATYHSVAEVGAYNVPDGAADSTDNPNVFYNDILDAGLGMSDPELSKVVAEDAYDSMKYLEECGVSFEKDKDSYLAFKACFSSKPRSHVIKNHFKPIVKALSDKVLKNKINIVEEMFITNLIVRQGQCFGAYALDSEGNSIIIRAKATVIATGGSSQLFKRNLYPSDITGDGYAFGYRAGAELINMEYMQVGIGISYPFTNLFGNYLWEAIPTITNIDGEEIIHKYTEKDITPKMVKETKVGHFPFSTRDISKFIEISVQKQINSGNCTENEGIYMDFSKADFNTLLSNKESSFSKMWPLTYEWYLKKGVDLYSDKVEISCFAHAVNGGLRIDRNAQTNILGLYAAGEAAGGPHGADRLGGNMAVTCQIFGKRAGKAAAIFSKKVIKHQEFKDTFQEEQEFISSFKGKGTYCISKIKAYLQESANQHLLIIRNKEGLDNFLGTLDKLDDMLHYETDIKSGVDLIASIEIKNLIEVGRIMTHAALKRKESRGSHYREDYPEPSSTFDKQISIKKEINR